MIYTVSAVAEVEAVAEAATAIAVASVEAEVDFDISLLQEIKKVSAAKNTNRVTGFLKLVAMGFIFLF
jgi:hypothetical protein